MLAKSPFQPFASNGLLPDLLAIVPPGAQLSPYSNLTSDNIGKTPGLPTEDGWQGHTAWTSFTATKQHLARWQQLIGNGPCNVGLNARTLHAFDIDTHDASFARRVFDVMQAKLPNVLAEAGMRIGRAPGWLTVFKPETPHRKSRVRFIHQVTGEKSAVELLGVGQQYVIAGMHPTGKPYEWRKVGGTVLAERRLDQFSVTLETLLGEFWAALPDAFADLPFDLFKPAQARLATGAGHAGGEIQALLAPDLDAVALALESLPNRPGDKRDYDEWIGFLHAIAGATGKSDAGRALWLAWSAQWDDSAAGNAAADRRWQTLDPRQISIGWPWLREKASAADPGYALAMAKDDFAGEHINGVAVMDGGLFAKPSSDADDLAALIDGLAGADDIAGVNAVLKKMARSSMTNAAREHAMKRIKKLTGLNLGTLQRQLANDIRNLRRDASDTSIRLAEVARDHFHADKIAFYKGGWWRFNGRHWEREASDAFIHAVLLKEVAADDDLLMSKGGQQQHAHSMIKAAISNLSAMCSKVLTPLDDPTFTIRTAINLRNGTLWFDTKGVPSLRPHNPKDCFLGMVDIEYDPLATGTLYDETLREMQSRTFYTLRAGEDREDWEAVKETVDRRQATEQTPATLPDGRQAWRTGASYKVLDLSDNCRLVNEILGYALIADRFARCFVIFKGNGVNGKSELIRTVAARMSGMVHSTTIDNLDTRFVLAQLHGKTLLTIDEGADAEAPSHRIKELAENQAIATDVKGKEFVNVLLTVLPIVNTNGHFFTRDASDGMRSRIIIVPFNRRYSEADRINNPWPRLQGNEQEMSAALNRWVDGLSDVIRRRYVLRSKAGIEAVTAWETRNTAETAFVADWATLVRPLDSKSDGERADVLHNAFLHYHNLFIGTRLPHGRNKFNETLEQMGYEKYQSDGAAHFRGLWLSTTKMKSAGFANEFTPLDLEAS